ncbi:MAG: glycogen synthase GlgA, partial [Lachnospiraceae bacterium]|nr:glycogen synthase GlgA [Lachnospiraceae bacterium]
MNVLFAAFEAVPFLKTGGLGDVAGSLPPALKKAGCDVRVIIPKFLDMPDEYKSKLEHVTDFYVPLGWRNQYCGIEQLEHNGVTYYFVDNEAYFARHGAYGYFDDGERIAFFSKAIVECIQYLPDFECDVLHCNDWHTALAPVFLREFYGGIPLYDNIKTVFTVHNLKFQGQFTDLILGDILGLSHIAPAAQQLRCDRTSINYMQGALCYSDILSTVSPTYAGEIQNSYYGEHMEKIFQRRNHVLYGILNGIDTDVYNPEKDMDIAKQFSSDNIDGKKECKRAIQEELGLEQNPDIPLIIMIGRLTEQKGMDLVKKVLDELMRESVQVAILGTGDREYEDTLRYFENVYRGKLSARIMFDEKLSHRMYAGADMILMPSRFEPCGLSQMIAMAYGTLPIVREVGGLKDSVKPYNMYTGEGTGFSFANYNAHEMLFTIKNAIYVYYNKKDDWNKLQQTAMNEDFSWSQAAESYVDMYLRLHPEAAGIRKQDADEDGSEQTDNNAEGEEEKKTDVTKEDAETKKTSASRKKSESTKTARTKKAAEPKKGTKTKKAAEPKSSVKAEKAAEPEKPAKEEKAAEPEKPEKAEKAAEPEKPAKAEKASEAKKPG